MTKAKLPYDPPIDRREWKRLINWCNHPKAEAVVLDGTPYAHCPDCLVILPRLYANAQ